MDEVRSDISNAGMQPLLMSQQTSDGCSIPASEYLWASKYDAQILLPFWQLPACG
jgi:hypothetical protein